MGSKMIVVGACLMCWLALVIGSQKPEAQASEAKASKSLTVVIRAAIDALQSLGEVFDVKKFGAKADGKSDDSKAIASAWKEACRSENPSTVVISKGDYMVGSLMFKGPCKSPVSLHIEGNLKAPVDVERLSSQDGWIVFLDIDGLKVSGGGTFDGQGSYAWAKNDCRKTGKCSSLPTNLRFSSVTNSKIQDIASLNSKLFHMNILNCKNLTLQNVTINAPENSLNTNGIHIGRSNGIHITDAEIKTGEDCISLGDGCQQISIEKVTCGPGHGISIGSLGRYHDEQPVNGVTVRNCTLNNTMNGVRIKTWPDSPSGVASDMHFADIIMNNVSNPILIDQRYCPYGECETKAPSRVRISNVSFKNISGTSATQLAVKLACSRGMPCRNVNIGDIHLTYTAQGTAFSECMNIRPVVSGKMVPRACFKNT